MNRAINVTNYDIIEFNGVKFAAQSLEIFANLAEAGEPLRFVKREDDVVTVQRFPKVHVRSSTDGDWEALYLDGKKVDASHSFRWWNPLDWLSIKYTSNEVECDPYNTDAAFPEVLP